MLKINVIGKGNVGVSLVEAFQNKAIVNLIDSRDITHRLPEADINIVSVSDNAIEEVASRLKESDALLCHTSGSIPMDVLKRYGKNVGVFYPLQTFTASVAVDFFKIHFFLEANTPENLSILEKTASLLSPNIHITDSEKRRKLHLASVFACNFTNALASMAEEILKNSGFDFNVILPLMQQTVTKLELLKPKEAQTGPAVRGDSKVLDTHINMLANSPKKQEIYKLITEYISNH